MSFFTFLGEKKKTQRTGPASQNLTSAMNLNKGRSVMEGIQGSNMMDLVLATAVFLQIKHISHYYTV